MLLCSTHARFNIKRVIRNVCLVTVSQELRDACVTDACTQAAKQCFYILLMMETRIKTGLKIRCFFTNESLLTRRSEL